MTAPYDRIGTDASLGNTKKRVRTLESLVGGGGVGYAPNATLFAYGPGVTQPIDVTASMEMYQVGPIGYVWVTVYCGAGYTPGSLSNGFRIEWDAIDILGQTTPLPINAAGIGAVTGFATQDATGLATPVWGTWGTGGERALYLWWGGATPGGWTPINDGSPYIWANQDIMFMGSGTFIAYPPSPNPWP